MDSVSGPGATVQPELAHVQVPTEDQLSEGMPALGAVSAAGGRVAAAAVGTRDSACPADGARPADPDTTQDV